MRGAVAQLYILGYMAGSQPVSLVAVSPREASLFYPSLECYSAEKNATVRRRRSHFKQQYSMIFEITDDGHNRQDFY